jgi:hypothetical protein
MVDVRGPAHEIYDALARNLYSRRLLLWPGKVMDRVRQTESSELLKWALDGDGPKAAVPAASFVPAAGEQTKPSWVTRAPAKSESWQGPEN